MIRIEHKFQYADVYKGNWIVARIYEDGSGGKLVKVLTTGADFTAVNEMDAINQIKTNLGEM